MLKTPQFHENQPNLDTSSIIEPQYLPHHLETSEIIKNNIDFHDFFFCENVEAINDCIGLDKEYIYLAPSQEHLTHKTVEQIIENNGLENRKKPIFLTKKIKPKGRIIINIINEKTKNCRKIHKKEAFDNILAKIQVHYINFIINICNDALKLIFKNQKHYFRQIDYKFKSTISFNNFNQLKGIPIKTLLEKEISKKYKSTNRLINYETLSFATSISKWLNDFFNINYLHLFSIYYNNCKPLKKIIFKGKEIFLSKSTKSFYSLVKKNSIIKDNILSVVRLAYFNGNKNINEKFIITKSENINKEN